MTAINRGWGVFTEVDEPVRQELAQARHLVDAIKYARSYTEALPYIKLREHHLLCADLLRSGAWRFTDRPPRPG